MHAYNKLTAPVVVLLTSLSIIGVAEISLGQKASVPRPVPYQNSLDRDDVRQLLSLIGTGSTGKISREQWTAFMQGEFDRLDTDKDGTLDSKELAQCKLRVSPFARVNK